MSSRLLLVEVSSSMRSAIESFVESLGFDVHAAGAFQEAEDALLAQFRHYGTDFSGVLLGWPTVPDERANALIERLESSDFADLPVIVLSTDMRAETRAWVAGRKNTAVVAWKDYLRVAELLPRLLDMPPDSPPVAGDVFTTKFDNRDISLLIVDDSRSIRFALKELFTLHGYQVDLAGTHEETLRKARTRHYDIAIIDFYLQGGTGDALCRELIGDPDTGEITCTVLTGTYADHIIKRSLRAGAVECMFKSESSELLLARIDAISRFVRQRERRLAEQQELDAVIESLAGAVLLLDREGHVRYASPAAVQHLGFTSLAGLQHAQVPHPVTLRVAPERSVGRQVVALPSASGKPLPVQCQVLPLMGSTSTLLVIGHHPSQQRSLRLSLAKLNSRLGWRASAMTLIDDCRQALQQPSEARRSHVALIDCAVQPGDMTAAMLDPEAPFSTRILDEALRPQAEVHSAACTATGRFALLLAATTDAEAYRALRAVLRAVNALGDQEAVTELSTAAVVSSLTDVAEPALPTRLLRVQRALDVLGARQRNMALLLDHKRLMPVYAVKRRPSAGGDEPVNEQH